MLENIIEKNKRKSVRNHERHSLPEKASYVIIGSIDTSNCISGECISAKIHNITSEGILLHTEYHLKPGTLVKLKDLNDQPRTAIVVWSILHNNSYKTELLLV